MQLIMFLLYVHKLRNHINLLIVLVVCSIDPKLSEHTNVLVYQTYRTHKKNSAGGPWSLRGHGVSNKKRPFLLRTHVGAASQSVSQQLSPTTAHGRRTSGTPRGAPIRPACPGPPPVRLLLHRTAARRVVVVPSRSACPFQRRCGYLSLCPWPLPAPRDRPPGPSPVANLGLPPPRPRLPRSPAAGTGTRVTGDGGCDGRPLVKCAGDRPIQERAGG